MTFSCGQNDHIRVQVHEGEVGAHFIGIITSCDRVTETELSLNVDSPALDFPQENKEQV